MFLMASKINFIGIFVSPPMSVVIMKHITVSTSCLVCEQGTGMKKQWVNAFLQELGAKIALPMHSPGSK
jgi:hypothetical protein